MANEELKAAAQKELLRRRAGAELARRRGQTQAMPQQEQALPASDFVRNIPVNAWDIFKGLGSGAVDQVQKMAQDPMRVSPIYAGAQDLYNLAKPVAQNPQAAMNAVKQSASEKFGTPTRAWNTVVKNPVDTLMLAAPGVGLLGKGAELANMPRVANALTKTSSVFDPVNYVKKPIESASDFGADLIKTPPQDQTRMSAAILRKTMPQDLSVMDKLGQDAMLLDASPSMTGLARGVSSGVGQGTDNIVNALMSREQGKVGRLQAGAKSIFGPGRDPEAMAAELKKKAQAESSAYYNQAKQNTPEFRNSGLEDILSRQLTDPAKGMTQGARNANLGWMNQIEDAMKADTPQDAASRLHGLRQELDTITNPGPMASAAEKNTARAAKNARDVVDDILKNRVPGMAEGDAAFSKRMKQKDAFQYGYDSLEGGKSAVWPETFSKNVSKMPIEYVAQGQSSRIANAMGTQANDLSAIRKMIGGDADFNRAKLARTFGPRKVDKGVALVDAEGAKSQNFADIVRNSKTAQSQQAAKMIESNTPFKVDAGMTTLGLGAKITAGTANYLMNKIAGRVSTDTADALSKALTGNKATSESLLKALSNRKGVSIADKTLVRALLFSSAAHPSQAMP